MWEIFLYVNPLCSYCLNVEQSIIDFTRKNSISTQFHFITTYNMETINEYLEMKGCKLSDLDERTKCTKEIYDAALLYKSATFQGNKKARIFLMRMQDQINVQNLPFNEKTIMDAAIYAGLEYDTIMSYKDSESVEQGLKRDQQLIKDMNIRKAPSIVIFDNANPEEPGLVINDFGDDRDKQSIEDNLNDLLSRTLLEPSEQPSLKQEAKVLNFNDFRK
ncbi:DsbA family protein [Companilactobacillus metriopterae]|uniref:DsbA family protein n=1 Tax=Companilactobacillus metriopterae TaxID=1909267 RepID=UPI00100AA522|nr:DsbA family protein [Companilactobacillus metriopterae]